MKKLVIIPAYNESASIIKTIEDIKENAKEFDFVIINDCSTDDTLNICNKNNFNVIDLPINLGIGGAVQTGYRYAYENNYDIAVQFDGDGQHNAKYLQQMAECLVKNDLSMVIGSRFIKMEGFQSSGMRRIGIKYFTFLIKILTGKTITDPTSGLRMVNKTVIRKFSLNYPVDYPEPESVLAILKEDKRVEEVPVIMNEREEGTSSITIFKSVYYMIKVSLAILIERIRP